MGIASVSMGDAARAMTVLGSVLFAAASATAPPARSARTTQTYSLSYDAVWSALVAALAKDGYTIAAIDKDSGVVNTALLRLNEAMGERYADCGTAPLASTVATAVQASFLVRRSGSGATVEIRTMFKREREFDGRHAIVDCVTTGAFEADVRSMLGRDAREPVVARAAIPLVKFYCTAAPADPLNTSCARSMAGCEKRQADLVASVGDARPCEEITSAVCLRMHDPGGVVSERCFPGFSACDAARQKLIDPDHNVVVGTCEQGR